MKRAWTALTVAALAACSEAKVADALDPVGDGDDSAPDGNGLPGPVITDADDDGPSRDDSGPAGADDTVSAGSDDTLRSDTSDTSATSDTSDPGQGGPGGGNGGVVPTGFPGFGTGLPGLGGSGWPTPADSDTDPPLPGDTDFPFPLPSGFPELSDTQWEAILGRWFDTDGTPIFDTDFGGATGLPFPQQGPALPVGPPTVFSPLPLPLTWSAFP